MKTNRRGFLGILGAIPFIKKQKATAPHLKVRANISTGRAVQVAHPPELHSEIWHQIDAIEKHIRSIPPFWEMR